MATIATLIDGNFRVEIHDRVSMHGQYGTYIMNHVLSIYSD